MTLTTVPQMTGGIGRVALSHFYQHNFIFNNSADTELELISRTKGIDRIIDEFIFKFTHDQMIDWMYVDLTFLGVDPGSSPNRRLTCLQAAWHSSHEQEGRNSFHSSSQYPWRSAIS